MKISDLLNEDGRIVKGVNTTVDVGPNEIKTQAKKFGNSVDKDGRPPTLSKKIKGKSTNVLFNLGLSESNELDKPTPTIQMLARKWKISPKEILTQLKKGVKVEAEHTTDFDIAMEIALDHINEDPTYYDKLNFIEAESLGEIASSSQIYVDMDGVLADFFGEWARLMDVEHFTDINKKHDINDALQKIRDTDDFWLRLPLLPEAKNLLNLIKQVKGNYNICSSPLADDPNSEKHKRTWVEKNLSFFPPDNVYITHDKAQYATNEDGTPNILIDDYGVNIRKWEAAGGIGFKYKDHKFERTAKAIKQHMEQPATEDAPPGREKQVKALKKKFDDPGAPYAIAWAQHNKHGKPKKKESVQEGITLQFQRGDDFDTLHIKPKGKNRVELRGKPGYESGGYDAQDKLHQVLDRLGKAANFAELMNGEIVTINPKHPDGERAKKTAQDILSTENFADGKKKGKSRPGRVKRAGASCNGSVTALRKRAKNASGEKAKMYHWCANMKSGRNK